MRCAARAALLVLSFAACGEANSAVHERKADTTADTSAFTTSVPSRPTTMPAPTPTAAATPTVEPTESDEPTATHEPTATAPTTVAPTTVGTVVRSGANVSPDYPVGDPLAITIPAIDVSSELVSTGLLEDGTVAVPKDPSIAGWFVGGSRPGERGPAVIMGHVDSKRGPGVFWRLRDLPIGAIVTVETTTDPQQFVVEAVEQYPKDQFPTARVYGPVPRPALRLITCGGSFDRSIGHYRDNIVVYLSPVATP